MIRRLTCSSLLAAVAVTACSSPGDEAPLAEERPFDAVVAEARGQTVSLWMFGGDEQGNAYVDTSLIPAAKALGVDLRRVPIAETSEAITRILSERQAGETDGEVDLVWVNGNNFGTAKAAGGWLCGWADDLPNARFLDPQDPLLQQDFGVPVDGCESPWHKAQFTLVYNSDAIEDPPTTLQGVLDWAKDNPGRFTYPAPPDFTGSVFVREVLLSVNGGADEVPPAFDEKSAGAYANPTIAALQELEPFLWREGRTYPKDLNELDMLFAGGQVDMTMTYGPATLTKRVADGTFPASTKVLLLDEGTVGNASFLAIPSTSGSQAGAMVVANLALSPTEQIEKARSDVWGQFTVLDENRLSDTDRTAFRALPVSPVVPDYPTLSAGAHGELAAGWTPYLDDLWRREVLPG